MRDWLVVFGFLVLLVGLILGVPNALFQCTTSSSQSQFNGEPVCADSHAWALTGTAVSGVGVVALVMGWYSMPPPPAVYAAQVAARREQYLACKTCGRIYLEGSVAFCPGCGAKFSGP
jgi:hypothetical protein